jgi:long-subunit acyl-CoA synthetase (AMP-forming)
VIVLSNGEKLTPVAMEASLRDHPGVNGALVVGQEKFSPAAIIELTPDMANTVKTSEERASFIDSLWPYTVAANENAPTHAILAIDRIMIAPADKPFSRAGKGTIQRGATVKLFENEIEELYQRTEETVTRYVPKIDLDQDFDILQRQLGSIVEMVQH